MADMTKTGKHRCLYSYRQTSDKYIMDANLDNIAKELYGKIQTRFPSIQIGDEEANVLSKKQDIPKARFFEFEYEEGGKPLGTITMTLDDEDGLLIQFSGDLIDEKTNSTHRGAYRFIRSFRQFAKDRLLNFDASNIGKSNLDKRDYKFLAKRKEEPVMPQEQVMESKLFGKATVSYQDLGEARLIIKHTESINPDLPAGRTMHIGKIYIENANGERFMYPTRHLNGARALAEHIKHGGTPYDAIGMHVIGLSEELAQLRKFKGYVSRQGQLSEAMGDITTKVMERIDAVKKEIQQLQRPAYYEQFAESFEAQEEQMIPEEIANEWIDRLTIRTYNEELSAVFPYIYKLVDETQLPVRELGVDDLLDESEEETETMEYEGYDPADQLEEFFDKIVGENGDPNTPNKLFNPETQDAAIQELNKIFEKPVPVGSSGQAGLMALKGLIDDPEFAEMMSSVEDGSDTNTIANLFISQKSPELAAKINFDGQGASAEPEAPVAPEAPAEPAQAAAPKAPVAPEAPTAAPVAENDESPPWDVDPSDKQPGKIAVAGKHGYGHSAAKHLAHQGIKKALMRAKASGAKLDTPISLGGRNMTLHDAIEECGMTPMECGFDMMETLSGPEQIMKSIEGFWDGEKFTRGGTATKIEVVKNFKNGEYPNATPEDIKAVLAHIEQLDPSSSEIGRIKNLAGMGHDSTVDEGGEELAMPEISSGMDHVNSQVSQIKGMASGNYNENQSLSRILDLVNKI